LLRSSHPRRWIAAALAAAGLAAAALTWQEPAGAAAIPRYDHVLVVVLENHGYPQVIGDPAAPYLTSLAFGGARLKSFYAITHPSQPNYFALFSGGTQGVIGDMCPDSKWPLDKPNLAAELIAAGRTWGSYNEGLPEEGSTVCSDGATSYARKHNPWFAFSNVPASTGHTFDQFPADYAQLPTVSFVVPNQCNDMHSCPVATGDTWVKDKLSGYAEWAETHNSLLIVTADEDNGWYFNRIPVIFYGARVKPGWYDGLYTHYNLLRTLEDMYGTTHAGNAATTRAITETWS